MDDYETGLDILNDEKRKVVGKWLNYLTTAEIVFRKWRAISPDTPLTNEEVAHVRAIATSMKIGRDL